MKDNLLIIKSNYMIIYYSEKNKNKKSRMTKNDLNI
jgi:hypothetical protein